MLIVFLGIMVIKISIFIILAIITVLLSSKTFQTLWGGPVGYKPHSKDVFWKIKIDLGESHP
jgi:hypothetical protein